jgi:hypothetical protein
MRKRVLFGVFLLSANTVAKPVPAREPGVGEADQESLTLEAAIRRAWTRQSRLLAGDAMVERAKAEADAMWDLVLPTVSLSAALVRTDQPMMAFGMKLN